MTKIFESDEKLREVLQRERREKTVGLVKGAYDVLHEGHLNSFLAAKSVADILIVAVNSDDAIRRRKGSDRPIVPLKSRARLIAALECVDYVTTYTEESPYRLIKTVKPDVFFASHFESMTEDQRMEVERHTRLQCLPKQGGISTTEIIERIRRVSPQ